jgi:TIR domain
MKKQNRSGGSISASITGPISGQVAVGNNVMQSQRIGATAGVTKAEQPELRNHPLAGKLTRSLPKPLQLAFLSYARADTEFVVRLAKDLRQGGAGVWIDQLDIALGQRWDRAVEDALAKCAQLLVILSPIAVESTNVMDEVSLALEDGKTVVPVLHRECKIPFRLRRLQYVDLTLNYEAGLDRLLETLGARLETASTMKDEEKK